MGKDHFLIENVYEKSDKFTHQIQYSQTGLMFEEFSHEKQSLIYNKDSMTSLSLIESGSPV